MSKNIISFEKLTDKYIKEVRNWRNSDFVKSKMITDQYITLENHLKWWSSVKQDKSQLYSLVFYNSTPCGLISFTNINLSYKKAEFNMYLFEEKYTNFGIAIYAEYFFLYYAFEKLSLNKIYTNNIESNTKVISMHKNFGFSIDGILRDDISKNRKYQNIIHMSILKKEWKSCKSKIKPILENITDIKAIYQLKT